MNRILGWSVSSLALSLLVLAGCGGGGVEEPTKPTPTTAAPAAAPATVPSAAAEDDDIQPLIAWADVDVDEGKAPLTVQFKADIEGGKAPLKYVWKFGDGTPDSNEANPKHTYAKAGKYRADLEVNDSADDSDSDYVEIEVTGEGQ
jgi:PKD repeat protein